MSLNINKTSIQVNNLNIWESKYLKYKKKYTLLKQKIIDGGAPSMLTTAYHTIGANVSNVSVAKLNHIKLEKASTFFVGKFQDIEKRKAIISIYNIMSLNNITLKMLIEAVPLMDKINSAYTICNTNKFFIQNENCAQLNALTNYDYTKASGHGITNNMSVQKPTAYKARG